MNTTARSLSPGTIIHKRYQIKKELGHGGFGITYQVWDLQENCMLAMKEFMPLNEAMRNTGTLQVEPLKGHEEIYERIRKKFLDEAQLIYNYRNHPNIVEVKHLFRENNTAYYTMEYLEGTDFGKLISMCGSRISWDRLEPVMSQAVKALEAVHKSGIVHCDLSPDNMYILKNGTVKLIDFGAAKNYIKGPSSIIFMKEGYAPPEQYMSNGKLGPWTDIYAFAVMIYYAFTGCLPPDAIKRLGGRQLKLPSEMGMTCPHEKWETVLNKALSLRPDDRYQDIRSFWNDLTGEKFQTVRTTKSGMTLSCISGYCKGYRFSGEKETIFGTDPERCHVRFPRGSEGISRVHMRIWKTGEDLMAMDMGSTYGTYLNQKRMTPGLVYVLSKDDYIQFGRAEIFRADYMETS